MEISYAVPAVAAGSAAVAPTDPTAGVTTVGIREARVIVSADSGHTLDGTGNARGYVYSKNLQRWCPAPELDFPVTPSGATFSGKRDRVSVQFDTWVQSGRVTWVADTVGADAGNITLTIEASGSNL